MKDMRKKLLMFAAIALGSLLCVAPALAADKGGPKRTIEDEAQSTFVRSWSGFYLGGQVGYGYATLDAVPSPAAIGVKDMVVNVNLGYDAQLTKYWIAGVWADYEFPTSQDWDQGWWTAGGRLGYLLAQDTMLYGLGGYTRSWKNSDVDAYLLGAGLEQRLGLGWSAKLEYRHHFIDTGTFLGDATADSVRLGVAYKFNVGN